MSGFPGPQSNAEVEAQRAQLARTSEAFRESTEGHRHLTGSSFSSHSVPRTPDADTILDAAALRAKLTDDHRAARLLERLVDYCVVLERVNGELQKLVRTIDRRENAQQEQGRER